MMCQRQSPIRKAAAYVGPSKALKWRHLVPRTQGLGDSGNQATGWGESPVTG